MTDPKPTFVDDDALPRTEAGAVELVPSEPCTDRWVYKPDTKIKFSVSLGFMRAVQTFTIAGATGLPAEQLSKMTEAQIEDAIGAACRTWIAETVTGGWARAEDSDA
jgi:hypothetical protein